MKSFNILGMCLAVFSSGCVSFNNVQSDAELQLRPDEGIVLIGAPPGTKFVIHSGELKDGKFTSDGWLPDGIVGTSENGFLVRKLRSQPLGKAYALVSVTTKKTFSANCGQSLATFNVSPGEAQYITTFSITEEISSVQVGNYVDLNSAVQHMKAKFPGFTKKVIQVHPNEARQGRCRTEGGTINIPIYLPRSRSR